MNKGQEFGFVDAFRSMVIGLGVTTAILVIISVVMMLRIYNPRPGRQWGIIFCGISYFLTLLLAMFNVFRRLGEPATPHVFTAAVAVALGNLGLYLQIAHMLFHMPDFEKRFFKWFGKKGDHQL